MEKFYVGIDLGGTSVRIASCDGHSQDISQICKKDVVRRESPVEEIEETLIPLIDDICERKKHEGKRIDGIGIAMAALFERDTGVITNWPNNSKYKNFAIRQYFQNRYGVPVVLEDDANAAALGEQFCGAGRTYSDLIYVTVGTGIGSGIIINNTLVTGVHGWAGELGHIRVVGENAQCTCGAKGCLQALACGPVIFREVQKTNFYKQSEKPSELTLQKCVAYARQGNEELRQIFCRAGNYIGGALANLVILLDIPLIIVGGGVAQAGEILLGPIRDAAARSLGNRRDICIVPSNLNDKNGVIGALVLAEKRAYIGKGRSSYDVGKEEREYCNY